MVLYTLANSGAAGLRSPELLDCENDICLPEEHKCISDANILKKIWQTYLQSFHFSTFPQCLFDIFKDGKFSRKKIVLLNFFDELKYPM